MHVHIYKHSTHNLHDIARCLPPHIPLHFTPTRHPVRLIWLIVCHNLLRDRNLACWSSICLWMCHKHKLYEEPKMLCLQAEASFGAIETHGAKDCYRNCVSRLNKINKVWIKSRSQKNVSNVLKISEIMTAKWSSYVSMNGNQHPVNMMVWKHSKTKCIKLLSEW